MLVLAILASILSLLVPPPVGARLSPSAPPTTASSVPASPPISVRLRAQWTDTPLLLEMLEAAHTEEPSSFWTLLTHLTSRWALRDVEADSYLSAESLAHIQAGNAGYALAHASDQAIYRAAQSIMRRQELLTQRGAMENWRLALALRAESAKVAAHWNAYRTSGVQHRWEDAVPYAEAKSACGSWVEWKGSVICSDVELREKLGMHDGSPSGNISILPFDHVFSPSSYGASKGERTESAAPPSGTIDAPAAVLYGDPFSSNFWPLHTTLFEHALGHRTKPQDVDQRHPFVYVLRWRPPPSIDWPNASAGPTGKAPPRRPAHLEGWGATLDLKKVDYLVIDDRKLREVENPDSLPHALGERQDVDQAQRLVTDREWMDSQLGVQSGKASRNISLSQLNEDDLYDLDVRAAYVIASASDPLRALRQLSQDFPVHAVDLARRSSAALTEPSEDFLGELAVNQDTAIEAGHGEVWINGKVVTDRDFKPFSLLSILREERALVNGLSHPLLHLNVSQAIDILSNSSLSKAMDSREDIEGAYFDASDRIERNSVELSEAEARSDEESGDGDADVGAIEWWNDLEDPRMRGRGSDSLQELLKPLWPGQFPTIRRNLFHAVFILDLRRKDSCLFLAETLLTAAKRIGVRVGFVPGGLEESTHRAALSQSPKEQKQAQAAEQLARLYWDLSLRLGLEDAAKWLKRLARSASGGKQVDPVFARKEYEQALRRSGLLADDLPRGEDFETWTAHVVAGRGTHVGRLRERRARAYIRRLRATMEESERGHVFVDGQHVAFHPQIFQHIQQLLSIHSQNLGVMYYYGRISDDDPGLETWFYDQPTTFSSRSSLVFPPTPSSEEGYDGDGTGTAGASEDGKLTSRAISLVDAYDAAQGTLATTKFVYPEEASMQSAINATMWLLTDLDSEEGSSLLIAALEAMSQYPFRLGLVHHRKTAASDGGQPAQLLHLSTFVHQALTSEHATARSPSALVEVAREAHSLYAGRAKPQIGRVEAEQLDQIALGNDPNGAGDAPSKTNILLQAGADLAATAVAGEAWKQASRGFAQSVGVEPGANAFLVNGRLIEGFAPQHVHSQDVASLVAFEDAKRAEPVAAVLEYVGGLPVPKTSPRRREDVVALASSIVSLAYFRDERKEGFFVAKPTPRSALIDTVTTKYTAFEIGDRESADIRVQAMIDPLTEIAQRWSSVLTMLAAMPNVYIRVILNPINALKEVPVKRFYRQSAPAQLRFDSQGRTLSQPLVFAGMPEDAVLTLGLDTPPSWLTMPEEAVYDLDNIRLRDVPAAGREAGVSAVYELKSVLIEGHARDEANMRQIPRGLQLILETPDGSQQLDTIVMANLAYFQFRAQPGLYRLRIRPGRSDELYTMRSVGNLGWGSPSVEVTGTDITLDTLRGLTIYPRVAKRKGKEMESLIIDLPKDADNTRSSGAGAGVEKKEGGGGGLLSSAKTLLDSIGGKARGAANVDEPTAVTSKRTRADINIFTVASGHLYERMTYIMMISVLRHTRRSVKFWFIENFLSPSFKEFVPHLAREYGFEYELVTYAWPHWLRGQHEKQRVIWGYKILFLDVLFPLGLDKVIFVDADQVVRADLMELIEEDLNGAPYAYAPMGNDSYDMDNYRFWEQGYWKSFLRGRPYHISALYVVDLVRFRRIAAGDILRGQYQALSADPNSLANLDQDLPNNMQFQLPIHTLDRNWLWCETWCSQERLPLAKTIDLCQNPKSREGKLDRARRQVPEWSEYDDEVAAFARRLAERDELGVNVVAEAQSREGHPKGGSLGDRGKDQGMSDDGTPEQSAGESAGDAQAGGGQARGAREEAEQETASPPHDEL